MWDVISRLRRWPTQIEADLQREYHIDLADWHRGAITSRRVLVLLEGLTENSRYRTDFERGGNWPVWMQMLKDLHKETALHRASLYAGGDNEYSPTIYLDPLEAVEHAEEEQAETAFIEQSEEELATMMGWT